MVKVQSWQCLTRTSAPAPTPTPTPTLTLTPPQGAKSELVPGSSGRRASIHVLLEGGERLVQLWLHEATRNDFNPSPDPIPPDSNPITSPHPNPNPNLTPT